MAGRSVVAWNAVTGSSGSGDGSTLANADLPIRLPTGILEGDLHLLFVQSDGANSLPTNVSGWTLIKDLYSNTAGSSYYPFLCRVYARTYTSGTTGAFTNISGASRQFYYLSIAIKDMRLEHAVSGIYAQVVTAPFTWPDANTGQALIHAGNIQSFRISAMQPNTSPTITVATFPSTFPTFASGTTIDYAQFRGGTPSTNQRRYMFVYGGNEVTSTNVPINISSDTNLSLPSTYSASSTNVGIPHVFIVIRAPIVPYETQQGFQSDVFQLNAFQYVELKPTLFTNTNTFYGTGVKYNQSVEAGLYTRTNTFSAPKVTQLIKPTRLDSTVTFFGIDIDYTVSPGIYYNQQKFPPSIVYTGPLIDTFSAFQAGSFQSSSFQTDTIFAAVTGVRPGLFTNTNTFYGSQVSTGAVTVIPTRFNNTSTFYGSQIRTGSVGIVSTRFDNTNTFYSSSVAVSASSIRPALYSNTSTFYTLTVTPGSVTVVPAIYNNTNTFYSAAIKPPPTIVVATRFNNTNSFYAASVTVGTASIRPALYSNTSTFYTRSIATGSVSVIPTRFDNTNTFYDSQVRTGAVTVIPTRFDNTNTFYSSAISVATASVRPNLYSNSTTFYSSRISTGAVTVISTRFDNTTTFYSSTVKPPTATIVYTRFVNTNQFYSATIKYTIKPGIFNNTNTIYASRVTPGSVNIVATRFDNSNSIGLPTISVGKVTVIPTRFNNTNNFFDSSIKATYSINVGLFTNTSSIKLPAVSVGSVSILPTRFTNTSTFFGSDIVTGKLAEIYTTYLYITDIYSSNYVQDTKPGIFIQDQPTSIDVSYLYIQDSYSPTYIQDTGLTTFTSSAINDINVLDSDSELYV